MLWKVSATFSAAALLVSSVSGFSVAPSALRPRFGAHVSQIRIRGTDLSAIRCEDKSYQLEEREDKDTWTTELYLHEDRTVIFGQTDGALYNGALGVWDVAPGTNDFKMVIRRRFESGQENTDMGKFNYEIKRYYVGEMTNVGESVGITGVINSHDPEDPANQEVGYFNMIDGTDEKASYEWKASRLTS